MAQLRDRADLAEEPFEHLGTRDQVLADDLDGLVAAHQLVVNEIHHPHAAAPEFLEDLIVGILGQARRQGRDVERGVHRCGVPRPRALTAPPLEPVEKAVGRHGADPFSAIDAVFQMDVDPVGRRIVEPAQRERSQNLLGRVGRSGKTHRGGSTSKSGRSFDIHSLKVRGIARPVTKILKIEKKPKQHHCMHRKADRNSGRLSVHPGLRQQRKRKTDKEIR